MIGATVSMIAGTLTHSLLVLAAGTSDSGPDWATQLTGIGTVILAAIAFIALFGTAYQLHSNRVSERETRAHLYLARYNEPEQIPYIYRMRKFISLHGTTEAKRVQEWERMTYTDRLRTIHALNFWEELAGMYNRKQVDQTIVRDYFGPGALDLGKDAHWFVAYQRTWNPRALEQLGNMCADIKRREEEEAEDARPTSGRISPDRAVLPELVRRYRARRNEKKRQKDATIT